MSHVGKNIQNENKNRFYHYFMFLQPRKLLSDVITNTYKLNTSTLIQLSSNH